MKAILLVRVSTNAQELDEQEKELFQLALKEGYAEEDIIPICEKESGIKLSEEERLGLNRLKEVVETEDVRDVYIWEVSRLARTKKVLFSMQEYFVNKKIQCTFKEPIFFKLLNSDGTVNDAADMTFTLYAQMAESEMRTKKARFKRAKKKMAEEGLFSGGYTPIYGYKIVNGRYEIDEESAAVVRLAFTLYNEKKIGCTKLSKELKERGYNVGVHTLEQMIKNEAYTGKKKQKVSGYERVYPVIIDAELWNKTVERRAANTLGDKYKGNRYDLGASLFRCPICGTHYSVSRTGKSALYGCYRHTIGHKKNEALDCPNSIHIRVHVLDYLLWLVAKENKIENLFLKESESKEHLQSEIDALIERINGYERSNFSLKSKKDRLAELYIDGSISKSMYDKKLAAIVSSLRENDVAIFSLRERMHILQSKINAKNIDDLEDYVKNIDSISKKEKYEIVHECITNVTIEEIADEGYEAKLIKIYTGSTYNSFIYYPHSHKKKLMLIKENGYRVPLVTNGEVPR